jgi:hypothetical protein
MRCSRRHFFGLRISSKRYPGNLNLLLFMLSLENISLSPCCNLAGDNSVDAKFCMDFAVTVWARAIQRTLVRSFRDPPLQMANTDQTHPLGDEETDQINPAVADGLTPAQLEWLGNQSTVVGRKKLQILRQALFEWVGEHLEYRFDEARFGDTVRRALEEFMTRHHEDLSAAKADSRVETP